MKSPLVFRIIKNNQINMVKQFLDDDHIVIGRGPDVHIDLDSSEVSTVHCIVEKRGSQYFLCDLGSELGTFKNNIQILDEPINSGDEFKVGAFTIVFLVGGSHKQTAITDIKNESVKPLLKTEVVVQSANSLKAEVLQKPNSINSKRKGVKTFAPASQFSDLKDHLKVGTGQRVEVIVSWKERILDTYHFAVSGKKQLGLNLDISVPEGSAPKNWLLLNLESGVIINTTSEMKVELLREGEVKVLNNSQHKLQQSEAYFIELINGLQIVVRFAPKTKVAVFDSPFLFGASEFASMLAALIFAVLTGLLVSLNKQKLPKPEENIERVAQVIFSTPPPVITKNEIAELIKQVEKEKIEEKKIVPEVPKKALLLDEKKEAKIFGDPVKDKTQKSNSPAKAAEVKPKDSKLKAKMFTSTKQGAAVKTSNTAGANAQSKEIDPNNSGLLAAFGTGGARTKLDQAYNGAGELIGAANKANGVSGFESSRQGDDLGAKAKDTGAGGVGTATQGIAGVGTKGRSSGTSNYGSGTGFGDKERVQISSGGSDEAFVGSIDKEAVRRVIKSALLQFKSCYEREYNQNTKIEGKVVINWEIHEQGIAKNAKVVKSKSTINNSVVEECVRSRMLGLRFPEPPAGTVADVSYPFVFQGQKH